MIDARTRPIHGVPTPSRRRRLRHPLGTRGGGPGQRRRGARLGGPTSTPTPCSTARCPPSSPAATSASAPTGPSRCPPTTSTCCRTAVPAAFGRRGRRPGQVIGIATDFTACTMVPTTADGTPLCELPGACRRPARLRQALEAPRRPAAGRPHQRAGPQARRGLAAAVRRPDLLGVGVRQGPGAARGGARRSTPRWRTSSRRPTGSSGSCAAATSATPAPPATRASTRTAPTRRRDFLAELNPDFADLRRGQARRPDRPAGRGRRHADRRRPPRGPACPRASPSPSATSTRTSPHRPPTRSASARWSRSWAPRPAT